eukprot:TRINITY_DN9934_c0_g2_i1.p1 TRINITY_DN9934_c0_g2~~TRINITY_DN9934_c0_g2_i1.p1  ORF type:complete len:188 (+),score=30.26 TRINITY_DN9934_c0_g2_i1:24-587(+)
MFLSDILHHYTTTRRFIVVLTIALFCYVCMVIYGDDLNQDGELVFDLRSRGFNTEDALRFLDLLGPVRRAKYLWLEWALDVVIPFALNTSIAMGLTLLFPATQRRKSTASTYIPLIPFGAFVADFAENNFIISLIKQYPSLNPVYVRACSVFVQVKWVLLYASLGCVVWGLVARFVHARSQQGHKSR